MNDFKQEHVNELLNTIAKIYENRKEHDALEKRVDELKAVLATVDFLEKQEKQLDNDTKQD